MDPENGEIRTSYKYFDPSLWKWQPKGIIWANSPVVQGNTIFLSIGYDYPAKMLRVNDEVTSVEEVYTDTLMDNHHHGLIELDGYLYGSYWISNGSGGWACLDWNTGEAMYDESWNSKGGMVYADGMLYVYEEKRRNVGLVKPDPSGFQVISSFQVEKGKTSLRAFLGSTGVGHHAVRTTHFMKVIFQAPRKSFSEKPSARSLGYRASIFTRVSSEICVPGSP